jgi:hypothetical protein
MAEIDGVTTKLDRPDVACPSSRSRILVIATREDLPMLREVIQVLGD